jgi:hypothetical protein
MSRFRRRPAASILEWLAWVEKYADRIDPVVHPSGMPAIPEATFEMLTQVPRRGRAPRWAVGVEEPLMGLHVEAGIATVRAAGEVTASTRLGTSERDAGSAGTIVPVAGLWWGASRAWTE